METLLHLHQKSLLYLVQAGRGAARAEVMNLWKCLNVQHLQCLHRDQTALLCPLDLAFGVKPSLSELKTQKNPATMNLNLVQWKKIRPSFENPHHLHRGKETTDDLLAEDGLVHTLDTSLALRFLFTGLLICFHSGLNKLNLLIKAVK